MQYGSHDSLKSLEFMLAWPQEFYEKILTLLEFVKDAKNRINTDIFFLTKFHSSIISGVLGKLLNSVCRHISPGIYIQTIDTCFEFWPEIVPRKLMYNKVTAVTKEPLKMCCWSLNYPWNTVEFSHIRCVGTLSHGCIALSMWEQYNRILFWILCTSSINMWCPAVGNWCAVLSRL